MPAASGDAAAPSSQPDAALAASPDSEEPGPDVEGFVLPPGAEIAPPLALMGYVDVGFANAGGDGTSFPPGDTRVPADYGVDTFAPAVNSRGDVASTDAMRPGDERLPAALGGHRRAPVVPAQHRQPGSALSGAARAGDGLRPAAAAAAVGRRRRGQRHPALRRAGVRPGDAVRRPRAVRGRRASSTPCSASSTSTTRPIFRTGVTPSLFARYTTGTALGAKAFYRLQIPALWSAVSLNARRHEQRTTSSRRCSRPTPASPACRSCPGGSATS